MMPIAFLVSTLRNSSANECVGIIKDLFSCQVLGNQLYGIFSHKDKWKNKILLIQKNWRQEDWIFSTPSDVLPKRLVLFSHLG